MSAVEIIASAAGAILLAAMGWQIHAMARLERRLEDGLEAAAADRRRLEEAATADRRRLEEAAAADRRRLEEAAAADRRRLEERIYGVAIGLGRLEGRLPYAGRPTKPPPAPPSAAEA